ncbi:MAG TPA: lysine--tRNA ligase [Candidatus Saccharimonadales bacterium]|nr:lysine--tRNA ligase [Candidatus Saccharimonadales bacterium]
MATIKELRDERLRKLEDLKKLGMNPYPAHAERTHTLAAIRDRFDALEGRQVTVVGRVQNIRKFGKIAFVVAKDMSGMLQLFLAADKMAGLQAEDSQLGFEQLPLLDVGDFIEAHGVVAKTKTGEISVNVVRLRLLTKSLRPMPMAHDGFTNKEERLRRRYVDMNVNQDVRDRFVRRSKFWQANRQFLLDNGFIEINVPVLEHTTGGADANPFVTHMDALDQDFYLRISHELPLKRLLGAGFEKVFDIGPRFRNENYSDEHLPEHVAMEWYWAYADWEQGIQFTQDMVRATVDATWGTRQFSLANGQHIDFGEDGEDWPRISFVQVIKERYGLDVFTCTLEEAVAELKKIGGEVEKIDNRSRVLDKLWKKIRVEIAGPAFLVDIPTFLQPLAKLQPKDSRLTQQFNLLLGGTEACKAYSELNDPVDQLSRFVEQQNMRDAGDDEAMMLDIDFVEMLEYGMPPACGYGHSERLFWMLEGVTAREGVVFPQLRREIDATTKSVYPELFKDEKATPKKPAEPAKPTKSTRKKS